MKHGVIVAAVILGIGLFPPLEAAKKQKSRSTSDVEQEEEKLRAEERKLLEKQLELQDRKKTLLEEKLRLLEAQEQAPPFSPPASPKVAEPKKKSPEAPKIADPVFETPAPLPVKEEKAKPAVAPPSTSGQKRASDLPEGWEEETTLPEGAVMIEDLGKKKAPAKTTAKPPPPAAPVISAKPEEPHSIPVLQPPPVEPKEEVAAPSPARATTTPGKSDLPEGWEEETDIPAGYVPLERVRQYPGSGVPAASPPPSTGDTIGSPTFPTEQKKQREETAAPSSPATKKPAKQPKRWE